MTHQILASVAMNCLRCHKWTDGVHVLSETTGHSLSVEYVCAHCCPQCVQAPPLDEGEVRPVVDPVQEFLFEE